MGEGDVIEILNGGISREKYVKDGETLWPKNPQMVVFKFKMYKQNGKPVQKEEADLDAAVSDEDLPF